MLTALQSWSFSLTAAGVVRAVGRTLAAAFRRARKLRPSILTVALLATGLLLTDVHGRSPKKVHHFDLVPGDATLTLRDFARQADAQLLYSAVDIDGIRTSAVQGDFTALAALEILLKDTHLQAKQERKTGAIAIKRTSPASASSSTQTDSTAPKTVQTKFAANRATTNKISRFLAALAGPVGGETESSPTSNQEEAILLSPFELVTSPQGNWYATNTVSATRFNTPLADLPLTINAVTSDFINLIGASNLAEVMRYTTGVAAGASGPTQGGIGSNYIERFKIRGLPVVFVFRDGTRNWRGNEPLFMERVEVLKGPTAILYGESLPGGTLNYLTKLPQFQATATVGFSVDSYGAYRGNIDATGPIGSSSKIAYRLIAGYEGGRSFIRHMTQDYWPFLASVLLKPSERTKIYISMESLDRHVDNPQSNGTMAWRGPLNEGRVNPLSGGMGQPLGISPNARPGSNPFGDPILGAYFEQHVSSYTATLEQNLSRNLDLRSSWNFAKTPQSFLTSSNNDVDVIDGPLVDPVSRAPIIAAPGSTLVYLGNPYVVGQGSTLTGNAIASATAGAFQNGVRRIAAYTLGPGAGPVRFIGNNLSVPGFFDPNVVGPRPLSYSRNENAEVNWKTDLTYRFDVANTINRVLVGYEYYRGKYREYSTARNPNWSGNDADGVAANIAGNFVQDIYGRRWTGATPINNAFAPGANVEHSGGSSFYGTYFGQFFGSRLNTLAGFRSADLFITPFNQGVDTRHKRTVPQVGALYKITPDVGIYASYSKSFRLNNIRFPANPPGDENPGAYAPLALFPPQEGKGLDVGLKFQSSDKKISGNFTVFDIEYTQIPLTSATIVDNQGNFVAFPAGAQRSRGEEIELFWTPTPELQATGGITHLNATYTNVGGGQEYLQGERLGGTASWQGSLVVQYTFREGLWKGFSLALGSYYLGKGAQGDLPRFPPASYTVFDGMLGYVSHWKGQEISWALNVTNLANRYHYEDFTNPYRPRTFRLSAQIRY